MKKAIYAGTFDIFTVGHNAILKRALNIFDQITVLVAVHRTKKCMFSVEERVEMLKLLFGDDPRIIINSCNGLTVEYARKKGINVMIRGLRPTGDFESEFQMASMNHRLYSEIETVFLMTGGKHYFISSSMVKELLGHNADISEFVPPIIKDYIVALSDKRKVGY